MRAIITVLAFLMFTASLFSQPDYKLLENIHYYPTNSVRLDAYIQERCVLDIYYPANKQGFATIVWFHGGGLSAGQKEIPGALQNKGVAVIGVNYRLYPKVKSPAYLEDAAAAVAWAFNNLPELGGDTTQIFLAGHSAGGYLVSMLGLDKKWMQLHHIDANRIAGLIPFSGHTITHFTIREERGIPGTQPVVDSMAPLYHVRPDAPPILLITGDRELELLGRYEENAYLMRMMRVAGHTQTKLIELGGYDHGMAEPAFPLLLKEVEQIARIKHKNKN